jgi:hypothetical protein
MNLKKLLPLVLLSLLIICVFLPISEGQQPPTLSINPNTTQLTSTQIGSIINIDLTIDNAQNIYGWNLNLTWDPKIVELTDVKEGPFLSKGGQTFFTWDPSLSLETRSKGNIASVADVLLKTPGIDGNGVLATISFKVLDNGVSSISLEGSELASPTTDNQTQFITPIINNGVITIEHSTDPSPSSTASTIPSPTVPEYSTLILPLFCTMIVSILILGLLNRKNRKSLMNKSGR